ERLCAVDVRDRDDDDLEFEIDGARAAGLGCGFAACVGHALVELLRMWSGDESPAAADVAPPGEDTEGRRAKYRRILRRLCHLCRDCVRGSNRAHARPSPATVARSPRG